MRRSLWLCKLFPGIAWEKCQSPSFILSGDIIDNFGLYSTIHHFIADHLEIFTHINAMGGAWHDGSEVRIPWILFWHLAPVCEIEGPYPLYIATTSSPWNSRCVRLKKKILQTAQVSQVSLEKYMGGKIFYMYKLIRKLASPKVYCMMLKCARILLSVLNIN